MEALISEPGAGEANGAFGLNRRFRVTEDATDGAMTLFEEEVPAGVGPPLHIHHRQHETFIVLSGRMLFRCEGADSELGPGGIVVIPPGAAHSFRGLVDSTALILLTPGGGEAMFRAVAREGLSAPDDMARIAALAEESGLSFVGPPI